MPGKIKHGSNRRGKRTRIYRTWLDIKTRCTNPNNKDWKNYGGRGITVCKEWLHNFIAFRDWALVNGYEETLTIERRNNEGPYSPANCCWATRKVQEANKRRHGGEKLTAEQVLAIRADPRSQYDIALDYGVSQANISMIKTRKHWTHI